MHTICRILGESDLFDLKDRATKAQQTKSVDVGGVEFKIEEKYVQKDFYSARPHYVFKLIDPTGKEASKLILKHFKIGTATPLEAEQVYTSNDYQRRGLATFLYLYVSMRLRRPFKKSTTQSEEGASMWKSKLKSAFKKDSGFL